MVFEGIRGSVQYKEMHSMLERYMVVKPNVSNRKSIDLERIMDNMQAMSMNLENMRNVFQK